MTQSGYGFYFQALLEDEPKINVPIPFTITVTLANYPSATPHVENRFVTILVCDTLSFGWGKPSPKFLDGIIFSPYVVAEVTDETPFCTRPYTHFEIVSVTSTPSINISTDTFVIGTSNVPTITATVFTEALDGVTTKVRLQPYWIDVDNGGTIRYDLKGAPTETFPFKDVDIVWALPVCDDSVVTCPVLSYTYYLFEGPTAYPAIPHIPDSLSTLAGRADFCDVKTYLFEAPHDAYLSVSVGGTPPLTITANSVDAALDGTTVAAPMVV